MKHKYLVIIFFLSIIHSANAQSDKILWLKSFPFSSINGTIALDKQDNIYIAISAGPDSIDMDFGPDQFWLIPKFIYHGIAIGKYSKNGDLIWAGLIEGDIPPQGLSMSVDDNYNLYFGGRFDDSIDVDPSSNVNVVKTTNQLDFFIIKLNSTGGLVWHKQFGSSALDFLTSSICDSKGNVYLTGNFRGAMDFDPGSSNDNRLPNGSLDLFLIKLNQLGEYQWGIQFGGFQSSGNTVSLDPYENVVLTGQFGDNSNFNPRGVAKTHTVVGNRDFFVARYNKNGELISSFTGGGTQYDLSLAVSCTKNYGIYLFGNFRGNATFDHSNSNMDMTSVGSIAHFIARYDTTGKCLWRMQIPVVGSEFLYYNSVITDNSGNVYVVADFNAKLDMNPGSDSLIFNTKGLGDVFIQKLDKESNLLWAKKIGSSEAEDIHGVCLGQNNHLFLMGSYGDSCLFELDSLAVLRRAENGIKNEFLLKFGAINSSSNLDVINSKIAIYPNPANSHLKVIGLPENSTIKIYNSLGIEIHQFQTNESSINLDINNFQSGNYLIVISSNNVLYTRKLIIP